MSTLVYNVKFRPVRVGWCISNGDFVALTKAFRLSHCLWGGRFNPVIVIDDEAPARHLIELFHVDILIPVGEDERCRAFAKTITHLPDPLFREELFGKGWSSGRCVLLDVYHPIRKFFERHIKDKPTAKRNAILYQWAGSDPCAAAFEAMFGTYPTTEETGVNYREFVIKHTAAKEIEIDARSPLDGAAIRAVTPNALTGLDVSRELGAEYYETGFFVGEAGSFSHLVEFWNLRAAAIDLFFFDKNSTARFGPAVEALSEFLASLPPHPNLGPRRLCLWLKTNLSDEELKLFPAHLSLREVSESTWDDRIWKGLKVNPPLMYLGERSSLAQISEGPRRPTVTVPIGEMPGFNERPFNSQHLVVTLKPTVNYSCDDKFVFAVPFVPEMNEYFGREHHFHWNRTRAGKDGLGIITQLWTEHVTLFGMDRFSLARQLFRTFGIAAEVSQPGLVCEQLVRQMGGIQGCRVFKISGVRKLIEQFGPSQNFTRSAAMRLIADLDGVTGRPNFSAYENLHLEPRDTDRLKPEDAFTYLLNQGVFRVGLQLRCTSCRLEFWRALDDLTSLVTCEYCGREFNALPQLKDRDWAFRPSGLFGRGDHQEGGVPVALTLQQLDTTLRSESILWLPAMRLEPINAAVEPCETDFVLLCQDPRGRMSIVVGECKTNREISDEDVRKLSKVADAFPVERFDVFVVFAKTGTFSPEEIQRCRGADSGNRMRTILLSERELEPYFVYERAAREFDIKESAVCLEDMVEVTQAIFFEPRLR